MKTFLAYFEESTQEGIVVYDVKLPELEDHLIVAFHPEADTQTYQGLRYLQDNHPGINWQIRLYPTGFNKSNLIGYVRFHLDSKGKNFASDARVDPAWRRRGVATTIYKHANSQFHVTPSVALSKDAKKFWKSKPLG